MPPYYYDNDRRAIVGPGVCLEAPEGAFASLHLRENLCAAYRAGFEAALEDEFKKAEARRAKQRVYDRRRRVPTGRPRGRPRSAPPRPEPLYRIPPPDELREQRALAILRALDAHQGTRALTRDGVRAVVRGGTTLITDLLNLLTRGGAIEPVMIGIKPCGYALTARGRALLAEHAPDEAPAPGCAVESRSVT